MHTDPLSVYKEKIGCSAWKLAVSLEAQAKTITPQAACFFRIKKLETLLKKLKLKQSEDITSVDDIYGFRILAHSVEHIYLILKAISSKYPGYLDHDYIAHPKTNPNNPEKELRLVQYIAEKNGLTFEIQLTTPEWNKLNEELHAEYHKRKYGD